MWSKKATPVAISDEPVPSKFTSRAILVSAVSRRMLALRTTALIPQKSPRKAGLSTSPFHPSRHGLQEYVRFLLRAHGDAQRLLGEAMVRETADENLAGAQELEAMR